MYPYPTLSAAGPLFLAFYNRTCDSPAGIDGVGAGPALRGPATSPKWRRWVLRVVGTTAEGHDLVELKPAVGGARPAKCTALLRAASASCPSPSVGLGTGAGGVWVLVPMANQTGTFNIVASVSLLDSASYYSYYSPLAACADASATPPTQERAPGCRRFLTAPSSCPGAKIVLTAADDGSGAQRWVVTNTAAGPTASPPAAAPSPVPSPSPVMPSLPP